MMTPTPPKLVLPLLVLFLLIFSLTEGADKNKFKKCNDVAFCARQRAYAPYTLDYTLIPQGLTSKSRWSANIKESKTNTHYTLELIRYQDNILRLRINEEEPMKPRYEVRDVVLDNLSEEPFRSFDSQTNTLHLDDHHTVKIHPKEVRFDFYVGDQLAISANNRGLFYFEYLRERPPQFVGQHYDETIEQPEHPEEVVELVDTETSVEPQDFGPVDDQKKKKHVDVSGINMDRAWEESFAGSTDRSKYGPQSIGMDISFTAHQIYGLPEHTTSFALKSTNDPNGYSDPYRLFNLDVYDYEIETTMSIYGAVPFVMAHQPNLTTAVLWLNAAETWIDVEHQESSLGGYLGSILGYSETKPHRVDTHWMSETGIIDIFFMLGPSPSDVWRQWGRLVGTQELPPYFSIGYHQCRWNYIDESDVFGVNGKFEELDIPYDVLWLDIEHTQGKRYFTWDLKSFPNPIEMINKISSYGRKMVTIVDPHIKRDSGYEIHTQAEANNAYVKDEHGTDSYSGFCWPGSSSWIDFLSPEIRNWWAKQFDYSKYVSTPDVYIWNDMNEPSIFSGPEVTMEKNAIHYGGWEHRDVHNIYGMLMHRATSEGVVQRNPNKNKRSFVLARAFYAGSQRWGAVWTGDNGADWQHLNIGQSMLLSLGITGITFSGADVGGFLGNPSPELLTRWFQVGVYYPFFRGHAHHDTKRREPWVHGEPWTGRIRNAILTRYTILPYLYTYLYKAYITGIPVLRPLWAEFPTQTSTFTEQDTFLLGPAILVKPVTKEGQTQTEVDLPGDSNQLWYDVDTHEVYSGGERVLVDTPLERIAVFQRGGTVVPRKYRIRRSTTQMVNDPYTLVVAVNADGTARGEFYIDDGDSFDFKSGSYIYREFTYSTTEGVGVLQSAVLGDGKMYLRTKVERVVLIGVNQPTEVLVRTGEESYVVQWDYDLEKRVVKVKSPEVVMSNINWKIEFKF